jgi:hypothetical protein
VEAARIPWRPLGRLLVEQGLLTADELEHALAQQERTGRRLGETLVDCGFVSGPELSNALAAQYGIELTAETGFGTGLRTEIQRRHETDRGRILRPVPSADELTQPEPETEQAELEAPSQEEHLLHAQLEEQWAKLAAAEERLTESHRELTALAHEYDARRSQATRLARRARRAREQLGSGHERDQRIAQLQGEVRSREAEIDGLRSDCADLRAKLARAEAAAEEPLIESHRELVALAREYDRRRGQASRLARRARHAREGLRLQHERDERIAQLEESARGSDAEIGRLLEEHRREAERSKAAEKLLADKLTTVGQQLVDSERELASNRERRRSQLLRFVGRVRERDGRIERLAADVRGCDEEIERLRGANDELRRTAERRRAQATRFVTRLREPESEAPPTPAPAPADNHLVFVQLTGRYELIERQGPPPSRNSLVELPELCDRALIVSGLGRSPLPDDARPCIFVQPV